MPVTKPTTLINDCKKSRTFFRATRWQGKRYCPRCGFERKIYHLDDGRYKCKKCLRKFSEFTNTYLESVEIPFDKLSHLLYLFVLGVPSYRARNYFEVSLKTAQKIYTIFRQASYDYCLKALKETVLAGEIEMDETMFGGHRKGKRGWGAQGKQVVFGMYKRNGKVLTFPVSDRKQRTLLPLIAEHSEPGSIYYTDEYRGYSNLSIRGEHVVVKKKKGKPTTSGRKHLNGIEGFWSFAENWMYKYRGMPKHHFHLYLKETELRFNYRDRDLFQFLANLLTNLVPDRS